MSADSGKFRTSELPRRPCAAPAASITMAALRETTAMQPSTTQATPPAPPGTDPSPAWQQAWNRHDADALAALVTTDVEFVTVAGLRLRGRPEFLDHHRLMHATQMRTSRWTNLATTLRPLPGGLALQHLEWDIEGDFDPDGSPRPPRRGIFTWVLQLQPAPLILAGHNTNLAPALPHRPDPAPAHPRTAP
jgi:uncharacterized protein (TIGR02246 family)